MITSTAAMPVGSLAETSRARYLFLGQDTHLSHEGEFVAGLWKPIHDHAFSSFWVREEPDRPLLLRGEPIVRLLPPTPLSREILAAKSGDRFVGTTPVPLCERGEEGFLPRRVSTLIVTSPASATLPPLLTCVWPVHPEIGELTFDLDGVCFLSPSPQIPNPPNGGVFPRLVTKEYP